MLPFLILLSLIGSGKAVLFFRAPGDSLVKDDSKKARPVDAWTVPAGWDDLLVAEATHRNTCSENEKSQEAMDSLPGFLF